jgi:predicted MPP superfamily phosphohydrolase
MNLKNIPWKGEQKKICLRIKPSRYYSTLEYTNRGTEMTGLPIRFGYRLEITVFTLNTPK